MRVKSLVGALRSHIPRDMAKKLKKKYPQMYFEIIKIEATFLLVQLMIVVSSTVTLGKLFNLF